MTSTRPRIICFLILCAFCTFWDLYSKSVVFGDLGYPDRTSDPYFEGWISFRLYTSFNHGALWGIGQGMTWVFSLLSIVAALGISFWLFFGGGAKSWWVTIALSLILGGTFGNLYDRLGLHGCLDDQANVIHAVRDFLFFRFGNYNYPIFNFADVFLVTGAIMLVIKSFQEQPASVSDAAPVPRASSDTVNVEKAVQAGIVLLVVVFSANGLYAADSKSETLPKIPAENIQQLIKQLGDPSYQKREKATQDLIAAGAAAIPELVKTAKATDLESTARAIGILEKLYTAESDDAWDQAELALEELRSSTKKSVASRAALTLERHGAVRLERAVANVRKLGGGVKNYDNNTFPSRVTTSRIQYVTIGPQWKGGKSGLKYLKRLESIPAIYLIKGHKLDAKQLEELQQALPDTTIQARGKAYLGISGGPHPLGCQIGFVQPGRAADKAGLQSGDVITEFAEQKINAVGAALQGFDKLIDLIKKHNPGDKVKVTVRRFGRPMTMVVELGAWTDKKN